MFVSFFPRPVIFIWSALLWGIFAIGFWYWLGPQLGEWLGFHLQATGDKTVGAALFWSPPFLWFYLYFAMATGLFATAWIFLSPHPWSRWSILGSALILFTSYFQVQVSVAINGWYGPFYDLVQAALSKSAPVSLGQFYLQLATFAGIAFVAVTVGVLTKFFVSHYIFRWRTAMNDYYVENWPRLRTVEGASQRVQEDAMQFATSMEGLGVNLVDAIMTLIAFLPVLVVLSSNVTELPLVGEIPYPLVVAALLWAAFGTGFLALIGIRLPGLEFHNQRVEAAYRKELVYGEDDSNGRLTAQADGALRRRSAKLLSGLCQLHVLQRRPHSLSADRQHLPLYRARTDDRGGQDHARTHEPDSQCVFAGAILVPVSRERLASNRRTDFDLQAPAGFRTPHR